MTAAEIVEEGCASIVQALGSKLHCLKGKTFLVTGGAGFLGSWFLHALAYANDHVLLADPCQIVCVDNFIRGHPRWLGALADKSYTTIINTDIVRMTPSSLPRFNYAVHAASIASPSFYRKFPIETMDANVLGLRLLLDACVEREVEVESVLFMSSSEIYGDPPPERIPTDEDFWGHVSCVGPRACYDESKRYGETLCVNFHRVHGVPVKVARPFNNYGPGLSINDGRVIPDLARNVLAKEDIVLFSDGSPTRTFCYAADAVKGYLLVLLSDYNGEAFNIGSDDPEISMMELANLFTQIVDEEFSIKVRVRHEQHPEPKYLTDNPQRRCPNIRKAREKLGFSARYKLEEGLRKTLRWYSLEGNGG